MLVTMGHIKKKSMDLIDVVGGILYIIIII